VEAKRTGTVPFCLTADSYSHDDLKQECDDLGYAVQADIQSLPSRITTLYRWLTA
jgi:nitric oxide reductase activation protein